MSDCRITIRRDGPEPVRPWRASLETRLGAPDAAEVLVGYLPTWPEALTTAISAARFTTAGVTWRAVGLPDLDDALEASS